MEYNTRVFENSHCSSRVDIKNNKIISFKVTDDEHVHDGKVLPKLVEDIKKSKHMTVGKS